MVLSCMCKTTGWAQLEVPLNPAIVQGQLQKGSILCCSDLADPHWVLSGGHRNEWCTNNQGTTLAMVGHLLGFYKKIVKKTPACNKHLTSAPKKGLSMRVSVRLSQCSLFEYHDNDRSTVDYIDVSDKMFPGDV